MAGRVTKADACTEERFLKDVRNHQMEVLLDSGTYRHLKFRQPDSGCYWFEIITWPGRLCIAGDMGDFVFCRLNDMFEFFRHKHELGDKYRINPSYWAEKLTAHARDSGHTEFSPDKFKENVLHMVDQHFEDNDESGYKAIVLDEIKELVLPASLDSEEQAYREAMEYAHKESRFNMSDFYEVNCREYTFHFLWCLYAIVWAIEKYDAATQATPR